MKTIKTVLYILTLISVPITITLGILFINPFLYVITIVLLGLTILATKVHIKQKTKENEDDLLYDAFLTDSIKQDDE